MQPLNAHLMGEVWHFIVKAKECMYNVGTLRAVTLLCTMQDAGDGISCVELEALTALVNDNVNAFIKHASPGVVIA